MKAAVLEWCREHYIEPPTDERIDRLISAAVHTYESRFFAEIQSQLSLQTQQRLGLKFSGGLETRYQKV